MDVKERSTVGGPILSGNSFLYTEDSYRPAIYILKLKERINPELLQKAANQAVLAHPWALYGICQKNDAFYYHEGLAKTIQVSEADWEDLPPVGGESAQGHLIGIYHRDRTLTVSFFHGLTDGRGMFFFVEELLRAYEAYTRGEEYVPDRAPYEDRNTDPLKSVYDVYENMHLPAMESGSAGMGEKPSFLVPRRFENETAKASHCLIRADAESYMRFAKDCGARPVCVLVSACAKAVLKVMGETKQSLRVAVPVDFRETLEIPRTFRNCAMPPLMLDLTPELANGDIRALTAKVQQMISARTTKTAGVMAVKAMADMFGQMPPMPYRQGAEMFRQFVGGPAHPEGCFHRPSRLSLRDLSFRR